MLMVGEVVVGSAPGQAAVVEQRMEAAAAGPEEEVRTLKMLGQGARRRAVGVLARQVEAGVLKRRLKMVS
jgi:hypothetical protein